MKALQVTSTAFVNGQGIPQAYCQDGLDLSPSLHWSPPPEGTKSFSIVCEDTDAPQGHCVHWVMYNIPGDHLSIREGISQGMDRHGFQQGLNDFGICGYGGPNATKGLPHRYCYKVFALDSNLDLPEGATKKQLMESMIGHLLAVGQIMGKHPR